MLYRGKKNLEKCDNFIMKFLDYTKELIKMFGSYGSTMATFAFEAVFTIFGTSIGQIIAKALDYVDPWWNRGYVRNNGYIFN